MIIEIGSQPWSLWTSDKRMSMSTSMNQEGFCGRNGQLQH